MPIVNALKKFFAEHFGVTFPGTATDETIESVIRYAAENGHVVESELPPVTDADAGKVLSVNAQGKWAAGAIPAELPAYTAADAGKVLAVDTDGKLIWKTLE